MHEILSLTLEQWVLTRTYTVAELFVLSMPVHPITNDVDNLISVQLITDKFIGSRTTNNSSDTPML